PSVTEVIYPQLALASATLGLGATAFQGGEEMRGYMHIMEELSDRAPRNLGFRKPTFVAGKSTFLVGTDGEHMAWNNCIYLSSSEKDLQRDISSCESA